MKTILATFVILAAALVWYCQPTPNGLKAKAAERDAETAAVLDSINRF